VGLLRDAVAPSLPAAYGLFENVTLEEPEIDRYVPDLAAWPLKLMHSDTQWALPGDQCLLAVEVTLSTQARREYAKTSGYARAHVPVYLVVDNTERRCLLYQEPDSDRYRARREVPFGRPVTLPLDPPVAFDASEF